jgi:predicted nucleic acid-binding protein
MDDVIVDACCLINLCAAGDRHDLLKAAGGRWYLPSVVRAEAMFLRVEQPDGTVIQEPVDLLPFMESGVLTECHPEPGLELDLHVVLASRIDDGEAMALAIAKTRGWIVSTDDRKARRLANDLGVSVWTTPQIMKRWAEVTKSPQDVVRSRLLRIEQRARFFPASADPLCKWWQSCVTT